jgi:hypothetical protein
MDRIGNMEIIARPKGLRTAVVVHGTPCYYKYGSTIVTIKVLDSTTHG